MMGHLRADLMWSGVRAAIAAQKLVSLPRKELPSTTPDRFPRAHLLRNRRAPMRDGVTLATDVYLPADTGRRSARGPFPVVLIRMPYGIREPYAYMPAVGRHWARKGYACAIQDVRGKFGSEGEWDPLVHEVDDGYDTIEWIVHQPWCNGRVGMTGESYYALTQWAAAASRHPALRCISPGDMGVDFYALMYEGGALTLGSVALWMCDQLRHRYTNWFRFDTRHLPLADMADAAGLSSRLFRESVAHPTRDEFWLSYDLRDVLATIEIPVFLWGGWYDNLLPGTLDCWRGMEAADEGDVLRRPRWLTLGPNDHETSPDFSGTVGRIRLPDGPRTWDRVQAFLDAHLREDADADGSDTDGAAFAGTPRVRAYVTGGGHWREADRWPLPETTFTPLYLRGRGGLPAGGRLDAEPPSPDSSGSPAHASEPAASIRPLADGDRDSYLYDPLDPPAWWEGKDIWTAARHLGARRSIESRDDVLVYSSDPLIAPLEVVGPLRVVLWVSTTTPDTDFVASLTDVWPDGYVQLVQQGIRRLRYRTSQVEPALAEPGEVYRLEVDLAATGHLFAAGHQVRLEVASAEFDRWDRNPNTGHAFALDAETRVATQTIYHDARRPSHILLPIMPALPTTATIEEATRHA